MTIRIIRVVTFAEEADPDHVVTQAVLAQARRGDPVDPEQLPWTLLGREPSAAVSATWSIQVDGEPPIPITVNRPDD